MTHPFFEADTEPSVITTTSLVAALVTGDDPGRILFYLRSLGQNPKSLDELLAIINGLDDEEELHAWPVAGGVAVSVASDGAWHVFTE